MWLRYPYRRHCGCALKIYILKLLLSEDVPSDARADKVAWLLSEDRCFSVSSCYGALCHRYFPFGPTNSYDYVFSSIWKADVPIKVKTFGWICFINTIPTKDLLACRDILPYSSNLACVFCDEFGESLAYSLLLCQKVEVVWMEMENWLGLFFNKEIDLKESFWKWSSLCAHKKVKRSKLSCIWLAIVWNLWVCRNDIILKNTK